MGYEFQKVIAYITERRSKIILLTVILFASVLWLYHLGYKDLWLDEVFSFQVSSLCLRDILMYPDVHPPLYYVILHFFLHLGSSEFFLRVPSVIFGVLCIPLVYRLGKDFFDYRVGLLSAFLLATSPFFYWYAQETRMYTLFSLFSLLSLIFFTNAIRFNDLKLWAGFVASTTLGIYTHYFAFLIVLIEFLYIAIFIKQYRFIIRRYLTSLMIIIALFFPLITKILWGIEEKTGGTSWGMAPSLSFGREILYYFSTGYYISYSGLVSEYLSYFVILLFIIFLYGLHVSFKKQNEETAILAIWVLAPILVAFSLAFKIDFDPKYLIFILPIYLIVISKSLINIKEKYFAIFLVLTLIISASNSYLLYENYSKPKADWGSIATYIQDNSVPGDKVLAIPSYTKMCLTYYNLDPEDVFGLNIKSGGDLRPKVQKIILNTPRVWVPYTSFTAANDNGELLLNYLEQNCAKEYESNSQLYLCKYNPSFKLVNVSEIDDIVKNLGAGWYDLEEWEGTPTRWMQGNSTIFVYATEDKYTQMSFKAQSFRKPRELEIYANSTLIKQIDILPESSKIELSVPLKKGVNIIRFYSPGGCERPCDIRELNTTDCRCLSLAFQDVSLE